MKTVQGALVSSMVLLLGAASACGSEQREPAKAGSKAAPKPSKAAEATSTTIEAKWAWDLPAGLDAPKVPSDNPMSATKVKLGHALFMDKRLSADGSRSCYSCHQNELGNADGRETALGAGDKPIPRNTPTIWNVAYHDALYWDGRASSLEQQATGALKGAGMGLGDGLAAKAAELGKLPEYAAQFREAFAVKDGDAVTPDHVAMALSAYQRTLLCGDTPFDKKTLSGDAQAGHDLFMGKAKCVVCHTPPHFTDGLFHNLGLGGEDVGRGKPTKDEGDNFKFRTPTLRNVSKTAPYFHDGSAATLEEAVRFMAKGGKAGAPGLDPALSDVGLSDAEIGQIVAFLGALECTGKLEVIGDQAVAGITSPPRAEAPSKPG